MTTDRRFEDLLAWCAEVAAGFRGHEPQLDTAIRLKRDRDQMLARYVVEELGRRRDLDTAEVAEYVDRLRAGHGEAA